MDMNTLVITPYFKPTQITTGSIIETIGSYQVNKNQDFCFDYIGYLIQTHCPENVTKEITSSIDLIKVVFPKSNSKRISEIKRLLKLWLHEIGIATSTQKATLRHHSNGVKLFPLDESQDCCGSLKWDLNKNKIQLELTGSGCRYVNTSHNIFLPLYALLSRYQGVISEVDIAVDDLTGKYNLRYVQKAYSAGDYSPPRGCKPVKDPKGKYQGTLYLGRNDSAKSMCIYEKWRELGLPESHPFYGKWTRHELTLRRKNNHVINFDILVNPDEYFVGAYKLHKRLISNVQPRSPVREKSLELVNSLSRSAAYCKYQHGRVICKVNELTENTQDTIELLIREGSPRKFLLPSYVNHDDLKKSFVSHKGESFNHHFASLIEGHNPMNKRRIR